MRLVPGARVAVIGAGPSGLVAAKHALEAGFETTVFEAAGDLGGQWHSTAAHSGIWPGMTTNTSRAMTAFSDFPPPSGLPLHPEAAQIHAYLRAFADRFGVTDRIRWSSPVGRVSADGSVDGEPFDAVVVASGRFRRPRTAPVLEAFRGELIHSFDYPGAEPFRDRSVLVYGNGISGVEIAADLAGAARVVSACRKPRYVIQKVVAGVPSDWQWYTMAGALQRRLRPAAEWSRELRDRIVAVAGHPADFGAPEPDPDLLVAGLALGQDYLACVRDGLIACRPEIAEVRGREVVFADGSAESVDAIVSATGYDLDIPFLDEDVCKVVGRDLALYRRTLHPDLPRLGFIGQFLAQGPYFPLLELQARWIVATWAGEVAPPDEARMRAGLAEPRPALDPHNVLASTLAEELGVAPDVTAVPELAEALLFGPMLPARYRLRGPGAQPEAAGRFTDQLGTAARPPVEAADVDALEALGFGAEAALCRR